MVCGFGLPRGHSVATRFFVNAEMRKFVVLLGAGDGIRTRDIQLGKPNCRFPGLPLDYPGCPTVCAGLP